MVEFEENPAVLYEKELYVKKLKRSLDNWREVTLIVNSVLLWKKDYYPWTIIGIMSCLFIQLAYYEPSVLTIVSLTFLCITLLDYFGPIISSAIWKQDDWTVNQERELEKVCKSIADFIVATKLTWANAMEIKTNRPNLYYTVTIISLAILAWVGNAVNNFFITYSLVTTALLMPGLFHHGIIQNFYQNGLKLVAQTLRGYTTPKTKLH